MHLSRFPARLVLSAAVYLARPSFADEPTLPGIGAAMQEMVAKNEIAGAVTVVVTKDKVLHLECTGFADVAAKKAMNPETIFWIASMTKPITGMAILMLQDEGKLNVADPVAKYLPEFAGLKTPSGKAANLTITQILTHTSGLGEAGGPALKDAKTLADLVPLWLAAAWIDPVRGVAYLLMVQRANFPNSDASEVRRVFQQAAADAFEKK